MSYRSPRRTTNIERVSPTRSRISNVYMDEEYVSPTRTRTRQQPPQSPKKNIGTRRSLTRSDVSRRLDFSNELRDMEPRPVRRFTDTDEFDEIRMKYKMNNTRKMKSRDYSFDSDSDSDK